MKIKFIALGQSLRSFLKKTGANRFFGEPIDPPIEDKAASLSLSGPMITKENRDFITQKLHAYVCQINSIDASHFSYVEEESMKALHWGGNAKRLKDSMLCIDGVGEKLAGEIATDIVNVIYSELSIFNMKRAGITKAVWRHGGAGRAPREYHKTVWDGVSHNPPNGLNGYVFDLNNLPIIDLKTGERGVPGVLPECGCIATPVIDI